MFVSNLVARPYFSSVDIVPFNRKWELVNPLEFDHYYIRLNLFNDGDNTIYLKTANLVEANLARKAVGQYPENGITAQTITELAAMERTYLHKRKRKEQERPILEEWRKHGLLTQMADFFLAHYETLEPHRLQALHLLERAVKGNNNLIHLRGPFDSNQPKREKARRNRTPKSQRAANRPPTPPAIRQNGLGSQPGRGWLSKGTSNGLADDLERPDDGYYY